MRARIGIMKNDTGYHFLELDKMLFERNRIEKLETIIREKNLEIKDLQERYQEAVKLYEEALNDNK